ncbi:hypothetical protein D3C71_896630 [compost metagenome]
MSLRNITRKRRAHRTVGVADIKPERFALFVINIRFRLLQQLCVQHAVIERWVSLGAVNGFAWMRLGSFQQS